jgi:hypothetical protein
MAERDDTHPDGPSDIEKLLAEVERTLAAGTAQPAARRERGEPEPARGGLSARLRTASVSGAAAAAVVWVLFALLPFLRATSGAVGAFLATFVVVLLLPRR